jgi:peptidoglycan/xylan/chitin deacetylase (PgdA/CDA1 family)
VIGVIANPSDECVVREFFELFKTPWEFYQADRRYDVVLCAGHAGTGPLGEGGRRPGEGSGLPAPRALLIYSGDELPSDGAHDARIQSKALGGEVSVGGMIFPLYGNVVRFRQDKGRVLEDLHSHETVAYWAQDGETRYVRVGYDLFREVRMLLVQGQPPEQAGAPALDLHIALLRQLITGCGVPLAEIPPVPDGFSFIGCLTHDLDHARLRHHKFDSTMWGFLYRATVETAIRTAQGRLPAAKLMQNWAAAAKLPLVHYGLAKDFWYDFDRYLDLEHGHPSTFFVIPFAGRPGLPVNGEAPAARASGYDVSHIAEKLQQLKAAGCEIGLHGIDAWADSEQGREEARRISQACRTRPAGVRMHWLYQNGKSSQVLEDAEFDYDSSVGYNEAVGYRAGTGQVFRPLEAKRLLELPLHIMDTALFFADRLNLSEEQAWEAVMPLAAHAERQGGVLTLNWHDRSIAPERLWGDFYVRLLADLKSRGALFCTAGQAVSWFRKRRSVVFERTGIDGRVSAKICSDNDGKVPALRLRLHRPRSFPAAASEIADLPPGYTDTVLSDQTEFRLAS